VETVESLVHISHGNIAKAPVSMCFSYDLYRPKLFESILPVIDAIEICPDTISYSKGGKILFDERILEQLQSVNKEKKIFIHGVGLSIGSYDGMNVSYLSLLDTLFDKLAITWHSEHLAYCQVDGQNLNTMLAVPCTEEMLELLTARVLALRSRYGAPFLLENIANILPAQRYDYSLPVFLNQLSQASGCGLILDIYNLECDEHNYDIALQNYIETLNLAAVKEIHIAGGTTDENMKLDIHSRKVADRTLQLTKQVLAKNSGVEVVTFELLPEAYSLYEPTEISEHIVEIKSKLGIL
jgi:uncharacterized protein (UPF0276 family)